MREKVCSQCYCAYNLLATVLQSLLRVMQASV